MFLLFLKKIAFYKVDICTHMAPLYTLFGQIGSLQDRFQPELVTLN